MTPIAWFVCAIYFFLLFSRAIVGRREVFFFQFRCEVGVKRAKKGERASDGTCTRVNGAEFVPFIDLQVFEIDERELLLECRARQYPFVFKTLTEIPFTSPPRWRMVIVREL